MDKTTDQDVTYIDYKQDLIAVLERIALAQEGMLEIAKEQNDVRRKRAVSDADLAEKMKEAMRRNA